MKIDAVDLTLFAWDDIPPTRYTAGGGRSAIGAYASSQVLESPQAYAEEAVKFKTDGWKAYKIHPPHPADEDIKVCQAVRKAVGDDYPLMLDSTWSYRFADAIRVGRAIEQLGFVWFEDPLNEEDIYSYVKLREKLDIPIMATEYPGGDIGTYAVWLTERATDYLRGDIPVKGGLTTMLKTAHLAEGFHMTYEVHHGGNSLNNMAQLHFACAIPQHDLFRGAAAARGAQVRAHQGHRDRQGRPCPLPEDAGHRRRDRFRAHQAQTDGGPELTKGTGDATTGWKGCVHNRRRRRHRPRHGGTVRRGGRQGRRGGYRRERRRGCGHVRPLPRGQLRRRRSFPALRCDRARERRGRNCRDGGPLRQARHPAQQCRRLDLAGRPGHGGAGGGVLAGDQARPLRHVPVQQDRDSEDHRGRRRLDHQHELERGPDGAAGSRLLYGGQGWRRLAHPLHGRRVCAPQDQGERDRSVGHADRAGEAAARGESRT